MEKEKRIYQEIWYVTQSNSVSPDYYSKMHIIKSDNEHMPGNFKTVKTFCNLVLSKTYNGGKTEIYNMKEGVDFKVLLQKELKSRNDKGTDQKGIYCLKCLKKAMEEQNDNNFN